MKICAYLSYILVLGWCCMSNINAQNTAIPKVHSHNDYHQDIPFWTAYIAGAESMEADIYFLDTTLFVTHHKSEIVPNRTLDVLYLDPLNTILALGFKFRPITLLIDIKSEPYSTLEALEITLKKYPNIVNHPDLKIVISGSRPKPCDFKNYPDCFYFDYQSRNQLPQCGALEKIGMISFNFRIFSKWNGIGALKKEDRKIIQTIVKEAHFMKKPIRFWATPDTEPAWKILAAIGVDYINTDLPMQCVRFFENQQ